MNEFELIRSLLTSLFRMNEMLKMENCNLFCIAIGNIARISQNILSFAELHLHILYVNGKLLSQ